MPAMYSCDVVINLAGENIGKSRWTQRNKQAILNSRINSVDALAKLINQMPELPGVWIQASAIGFYGANTPMPVNETGANGEGFLANVVERWESALELKQLDGTRKVYLRLGIVLSPKGGFLKQMLDVTNFGVAICLGNGNQKLSWIHLYDLIEVIRISIENNRYTGAINVVAPHAITCNNFSKLIKKYSRAVLILKIPSFIVRIIFGKEKANEMLLANQEIIPEKLMENGYLYRYEHIEKVLQ